MSTKIYDEHAFEDAIEAYLLEHGGYEELDSDEFDPNRGFFPDEVVSFVKQTQPSAWEELETAHRGNARERFLSDLQSALERLGPLEILRHGVRTTGARIKLSYSKPATSHNPDLEKKYAANKLAITTQLYYSQTNPGKSIDIALSVNGIPVVTAELKNPMTDQTYEHAKEQYRSDRDPSEPLMKFNRGALVHFAVDPNLAAYTTKLDGDDTSFLPFNRGHDGGAGNPEHPSGHRTAYLWEDVWARESLLDILHEYMHLEEEEIREQGVVIDTKEKMIFPRYHQLECVRDIETAALEDGPGEDYLVQHSTGSGKSKTIGWLAHRFVSLHDEQNNRIFDSIVVVTDRTVLDEQLQDTIYQIDHKTGVVHGIEGDQGPKSEELADAISSGKEIIITTLQTFPYVIEHTRSLPERDYAVMVDEAHSSQTGEMAKEMKQILAGLDISEDDDWEDVLAKSADARGQQENLSFFAFTATPKGKTLEAFGHAPEDGEMPVPFHVYSMRQAIEEGFIIDVLQNYITYDTFYNIVKTTEEDPQVPERKGTREITRFLELHPHNIAQKVEIIVEHFANNSQHKIGGKAKAMIVTSSRKQAVRYKKALDQYVDEHGYGDINALVAFSGTVRDNGQEYTEVKMNDGIKQSELPSKFSSNEYQFLVVADKYQTGFDEPLLHTMYVDKRLSGVRAVQTLSRLNRTHPGKEDTFVLDFVNERETIEESFQPFYERTTIEESSNPQHLYQLESELKAMRVFQQEEIDNFAEAYFSPANRATEQTHSKLYKYTQPARNRFITLTKDEQDTFRSKLRAYIRLYKFQSQVVNYSDTELEKLYTFGRFLYKQLPRDPDQPSVEFDDELALRYYRLEQQSKGSIELQETGGEVEVPTESGTGSREDEEVELSKLVDKINEALGTDFTEADQLFLEQIREDALEREQLKRIAEVNTKENFALEFDDTLKELFIDRMDQNQELFRMYMDNEKFQNLVTDLLRQQVYDAVQEGEA